MGITIIKQPSSVTAIVGTTAKLAVLAKGDGLTYQWQWRSASGSGWSNSGLASANTAYLEVPATEDRNGQGYSCLITDASGNQVRTDAVTLTIIDVGFVNRSTMQGIADAIRAKTETTEMISPSDMAVMIEGLGSKAEIMEGSFKPTSLTKSANLGATLPSSDNYIFVCTLKAGIGYTSTSPLPIVAAMVVNIDGAKSGWVRTPPISTAGNDSYSTGKLSISGDTISHSSYGFKARANYGWWYMYV